MQEHFAEPLLLNFLPSLHKDVLLNMGRLQHEGRGTALHTLSRCTSYAFLCLSLIQGQLLGSWTLLELESDTSVSQTPRRTCRVEMFRHDRGKDTMAYGLIDVRPITSNQPMNAKSARGPVDRDSVCTSCLCYPLLLHFLAKTYCHVSVTRSRPQPPASTRKIQGYQMHEVVHLQRC